jgi:cold shock protein
MATGKVLQFDHTRGYGFVAADDGGEDVFLHASVFDGDPYDLVPGRDLEFQIMAGDRGRKAFAVRFPEAKIPTFISSAQPSATGTVPTTGAGTGTGTGTEDDQMCDVLSQIEFGAQLTELLLTRVPELTGKQIMGVRTGVMEFAKKHNWVDS